MEVIDILTLGLPSGTAKGFFFNQESLRDFAIEAVTNWRRTAPSAA